MQMPKRSFIIIFSCFVPSSNLPPTSVVWRWFDNSSSFAFENDSRNCPNESDLSLVEVAMRMIRNGTRIYYPLSLITRRERESISRVFLSPYAVEVLIVQMDKAITFVDTEQALLRCPSPLREQSKRFHSISNTDANCDVELPVDFEGSSDSTCSSRSRPTETAPLFSLPSQHSLSPADPVERQTTEFHSHPRNATDRVEAEREFGQLVSSAAFTSTQSSLE